MYPHPSKALIPALTLLLLFSWATVSITGCATIRKGAATVLLPVDEEIKLGRQLSADIEKELTLHPSREVQRYISNLGQRVVVAAGDDRHKSMRFTFKVVDDPATVNAFAMPGGFIYIYSGLLLAAESEAEVVGVLAHEVAHVTKRHIAERLATAYGLQVLTSVALGQDASTAQQMVAAVIGTGYLLRFSREQEVEADVTAVQYTVSAGWSPHGLNSFFQRLGGDRQAGSRKIQSWVSTHPMPEDRIVHVQQAIRTYSSVPTHDGKAEHQRFVASLGSASGTKSAPTQQSGVGAAPSSTTGTRPSQTSTSSETESTPSAPAQRSAPTRSAPRR